MACLDTTVLIDLTGRGSRRQRERARTKVREIRGAGEALTTTRFNVAELWVGIVRSPSPPDEEQAVAEILGGLIVLEFDDRAARVFASLMGFLLDRGRPIGDMDALIASVALCQDPRIVTRNVRRFIDVPGLTVETY